MDYMFANAECSSGCESGWTLYLENSCVSPYTTHKSNDFVEEKMLNQEDEEEDLSMVSDASSGPPHVQEDEYYLHGCNHQASIDPAFPEKIGKREKKREKHKILEHPSLLDDTASSPIFNFSNKKFASMNNQASIPLPNIVDFSQGYSTSTTHFQEKPTFQEHYDFFQSSLSGNQLQQIKTNGMKRRGSDVKKYWC